MSPTPIPDSFASPLTALDTFLTEVNVPLLVSALLATTFLYKAIIYPRFFTPLRKIPGPNSHWLLGNNRDIEENEPGVPCRNWWKEYGPIVRFKGFFGTERVMFMNPDALHKVLTSDWVDFPRPLFLRNLLGTVAGYGLLTVTGDVHRKMRKAMNPAFSLTSLMMHMDMFYEITENLVNIIGKMVDDAPAGEGAIVPVYGWVSKATLDMICLASFGYKTDSLNNSDNELANAYEHLMTMQDGHNLMLGQIFFSIPGFSAYVNSEFGYRTKELIFTWLPFGSKVIKLTDTMHRIRALSKQMLDEKMAEAAQFGVSDVKEKRDIMSILIREREAEKSKGAGEVSMNDKAMMDQVLTFLSAGHDTTASSITWTLWLLAKDLASQQRLRDEVTPVFEATPRPEYRDLKDLPFLDGVVMESLRVMPAAPVTVRTSTKTTVLDGQVIPAGTQIMVPIRAVNTNKNVWGPDAEEFKPSRWANLPAEVQKNMNMNFLSFITGPHGCIGKTMSLMETKAAVAKLVATFVFEPTHATQQAQPDGAITMKPKDNMPLRVKRVGKA
ncbi:cytochrome P450 [Flagelloscypha sp. PMI_526]|nr:cytochrome P450 [Flagelloscypha sp. PMI_526]